MKRALTKLILLSLLLTAAASAQQKFDVTIGNVQPNSVVNLVGKPIFIYGMVSPAGASLKVNGTEAEVDDDGAYLVFVTPKVLEKKENEIFPKALLKFDIAYGGERKTIEKIIQVSLPPVTSQSDKLVIDDQWRQLPNENIYADKNESINVEVKGTPNCKVYFAIEGIDEKLPMAETEFINSFYWGDIVFGKGLTPEDDLIKGVYKGHFIPKEDLTDAEVTVTLEHPELGTISKTLKGKVTTVSSHQNRVVEVLPDPNLVTARYGPGKGYKLFLHEGIKLEAVGEQGNWLKVKLGSGSSAYIPSNSAKLLPEGTPPPNGSIQIIRTKDNGKKIDVNFGFTERVPVEIHQYDNPMRLEVTAYNVTANIDWVFYDIKAPLIKEIKHRQTGEHALTTTIYLNQKTHWGYESDYDGTILRLSINKPAKRNDGFLFWSNQLEGRRIVIDPGHSPEAGAVGPRGLSEKEVNIYISRKLKSMLEEAGAQVFLTRTEIEEPLPLYERRQKVTSFEPELSISIHNNAVPISVNPVEYNGTSVYYYYPQAKPLAEMIHNQLLTHTGIRNFGFYWDNLYMCRIPEAVSLLVEPAFIVLPGQEKLLMSEEFQNKIAESIYNAVEQFYEEYSE